MNKKDFDVLSKIEKNKPSELINCVGEESLKKYDLNHDETSKIKSEMNQWKSNMGQIHFENSIMTLLGVKEQIERPLLLTPLDIGDFNYLDKLGFPGKPPFTRGVYPTMYRGRKFTVRPIVGFGTPSYTNERIKYLISNGATGINVVFDLPTIQEYDSDDPLSKGQVGLCGVAIDSVDDMKELLSGIPLDKIDISLTTHYPSNTMILGSMYLVAARELGYDWNTLRGTTQNDLVMESVIRTAPSTLPPKVVFKMQVDNVEFLKTHVPKWNYVTFNGYNLREAGVDEITEVAVAFSNAIATSIEMINRGYPPDDFLDRMAFFWVVGNDFFMEVAKMRTARRLWYKIAKNLIGAKNERSWKCRFHVQTSGISLTRTEPLVNISRGTLHALSALLGGAQSLHVSGYDEAYSVPTELAHLISLRTQQVMQEETGLTEVIDPLGGSYYIEWLTDALEKKVSEMMDEIWEMGGIVSAIENGWLYNLISENNRIEQSLIENKTIKIVGTNTYTTEERKAEQINVFNYPAESEQIMVNKIIKLKQNRNDYEVKEALSLIGEAAEKGNNLFESVLNAAEKRATEGEIANVFRRKYGVQRPYISE